MTGPYEWREAPESDYAVIGDPIAHSLSPKMHGAAFEALGLELRYVAVRVPSGEVSLALGHLADLGYKGVNVTVPHKEEALEWSNEADGLSRRARAANTLDLGKRGAINTDGPGFLDTLAGLDLPAGSKAVILGAGGSARAIALAVAESGFRVSLWNRTRDRAERFVCESGLDAELLDLPAAQGAALIVNATAAGFEGEAPELDWSGTPENALAYDLSYGDGPSPFLRKASERGLRTADGLNLLVAQGARALEWWLGLKAPREAMLRALR